MAHVAAHISLGKAGHMATSNFTRGEIACSYKKEPPPQIEEQHLSRT